MSAKSKISLFVCVLLWVPAFLIRLVLILLGFVMVPITSRRHFIWGNNEHPHAPDWHMPGKPDWWRDYVWRAWRNPANNVRFWFTEPEDKNVSGFAEPEVAVRNSGFRSAYRWAWCFPFAEYWRIWATKKGEIAEFRIGWKFSGVPGFGFTTQLRRGK